MSFFQTDSLLNVQGVLIPTNQFCSACSIRNPRKINNMANNIGNVILGLIWIPMPHNNIWTSITSR